MLIPAAQQVSSQCRNGSVIGSLVMKKQTNHQRLRQIGPGPARIDTLRHLVDLGQKKHPELLSKQITLYLVLVLLNVRAAIWMC